MSNTLIQLPNFSYTSLDFDTIIDDVKKLIKEHPEYSDNWDDFLESNAGRMIVETVAFVIEKAASKLDWTAREMFISTATQRQSLINILKLINYRPTLPKAGKVAVKAKLTKWCSPFSIGPLESILGINADGTPVNFELLDIAEDGKPDYNYKFYFEPGDKTAPNLEFYNIPFFQGKTIVENDIYLDGVNNEKVTLTSYPVIEDTVRVVSLTTGNESVEVESFITPEAQQNDLSEAEKVPPYIIEIDDMNRAIVVFGSNDLVKTPVKGERLEITYRVGGGSNTNIVSGAINQTKTYTNGDQRISVIYTNPNAGTGGADEEKIEDAKLTAPISLRSANKTVTNEDYIFHLEDISNVMHASVVGKENEPKEIYSEYGYSLPPLDAWIYITPERQNWAEMDPYDYNNRLLISRPYTRHGVVEEEEIFISALMQSTYMIKYKKNKGFSMYITLHEDSPECTDWMAADSYVEGVDFTIDPVTSIFTRIQSSDGGSIPSGERTLKVRYIYDTLLDIDGNIDAGNSSLQFKNSTIKTFATSGADELIVLDTVPNSLYPQFIITVKNIKGDRTYELNTDYTINWENNTIVRTITGAISPGQTVIVYYANQWMKEELDISEEKEILDEIKSKKMICVDNHIKDALYTPFDVKATVYCYKNMRKLVQDNLETFLRSYYILDKGAFDTDIIKADIISKIMNYSGVRFVEIEYLGTNYELYRKYILGEITLEQLNQLNGQNVEYKIDPKYNEMAILANDEYSGTNIVENKRHGLIFYYRDA